MSNPNDFIFKIGILGPTRVGKTSLIAAVLHNATELLSGTPVSMETYDTKTERRLSQHHKELEGSIRAGEFHPGAVSGTEESFTYELKLNPGIDGAAGIRFSLLDYPGGWIDASRRPAEREEEWKRCKQWIKDSNVLLVPIESAVMMEANIAAHRRAVPFILNTHDVASVARDWAKARAARPDEPALLIFSPVKCESYFADNGGRQDASDPLFRHFEDYYGEVIRAVQKEAHNVQILYAPVDTVGCCEITNARWQTTEGNYSFAADYLVRKNASQSIVGADAVLISLCRALVNAGKKAEAKEALRLADAAQSAQHEADRSLNKAELATKYADQDEGVFVNVWLWMNGERKARERAAENSRHLAAKHQSSASEQQANASAQFQKVESFAETIERLAKEPLGSRARKL